MTNSMCQINAQQQLKHSVTWKQKFMQKTIILQYLIDKTPPTCNNFTHNLTRFTIKLSCGFENTESDKLKVIYWLESLDLIVWLLFYYACDIKILLIKYLTRLCMWYILTNSIYERFLLRLTKTYNNNFETHYMIF